MDWANYLCYFVLFGQIQTTSNLFNQQDCSSHLCSNVGYFDDHELMASYRSTKLYLALCICLQLLKLLKVFASLVPRYGPYYRARHPFTPRGTPPVHTTGHTTTPPTHTTRPHHASWSAAPVRPTARARVSVGLADSYPYPSL